MEAVDILSLLLFFTAAPKTFIHIHGLTEVPTLEQPQPSITTAGKNPTLQCIMRGSRVSHHVLSWYRQMNRKEIQFLVSHREKSRPAYGEGISHRFIPEVEESTNSFRLTIGNAEKGDEGTYYCAIWFSNQYIFGDGTEIKVLVDTVATHSPAVTLLGPSPVELQVQGSATFLCHAESFFPEELRIKWIINQKPAPYKSINFQVLKYSVTTFQKSSGISIPARVWELGVEVTCVIEHETGVQSRSTRWRNPTRHTPGECRVRSLLNADLEAAGNFTQEEKAEGEMLMLVDPSVLVIALCGYGAAIITSVVYASVLTLCFIRRRSVILKEETPRATGPRCPTLTTSM